MGNKRETPTAKPRNGRKAAEVASFLERQRHQQAKLEIWVDHLVELSVQGATYRQMAAFVTARGTEVNASEVYKFLHRRKRAHLVDAKKDVARISVERQQADALSDQMDRVVRPAVQASVSAQRPQGAEALGIEARRAETREAGLGSREPDPAEGRGTHNTPLPAATPPTSGPVSQQRETGRLPKFVWQPNSDDNQEW